MKTIFKSLLGIMVITILFMMIGILIQLYIPELEPIINIFQGFLFIILLMGFVIISKATFELISGTFLKDRR